MMFLYRQQCASAPLRGLANNNGGRFWFSKVMPFYFQAVFNPTMTCLRECLLIIIILQFDRIREASVYRLSVI